MLLLYRLYAGLQRSISFLVNVFECPLDCDKLMELPEETAFEMEFDLTVYAVMAVFVCVALLYLLGRCYHGRIDDRWKPDYLLRKWINIVVVLLWVEILVHKGYLGQKVARNAHNFRENTTSFRISAVWSRAAVTGAR